jgi:hypothetical protein
MVAEKVALFGGSSFRGRVNTDLERVRAGTATSTCGAQSNQRQALCALALGGAYLLACVEPSGPQWEESSPTSVLSVFVNSNQLVR